MNFEPIAPVYSTMFIGCYSNTDTKICLTFTKSNVWYNFIGDACKWMRYSTILITKFTIPFYVMTWSTNPSCRSPPLEVEGFDGERKNDTEKQAKTGHHNSCNADEIMPEPENMLDQHPCWQRSNSIGELHHCFNVSILWSNEAVETPSHGVRPIIPSPPHRNSLQ